MTNETKYTPGKWNECDDCEHSIIAYDAESDSMNELALVYAWDGKKTHLANRRLIACAPELLNALEIIENRLSNIPIASRSPEERLDELLDWIDKDILPLCKQLIARAKGGTQ